MITDLIGENTEIWMVYTLFEEDSALEYYHQLKDFNKAQKIGNWISNSANEDEEPPLNLYVETTEWHRDEKNELLRAIADDTVRAMWVCPFKNILIAPYDGGMDIIVPSTQQRDRLKNKYKDWLSHREDGL
nr:hypothetical protein [Riemerella columbina]